MKFLSESTRRRLLSTGIFGVVMGLFTKVFNPAIKSAELPQDQQERCTSFLFASKDAENYVKQIHVMRLELIGNLKMSKPEKTAEIERQLDDKFWDSHFAEIMHGFQADIDDHLTTEDTENIIRFFATPSGAQYLKWKDVVQSRSSNAYKAVKAMHFKIGQINRNILDKGKDHIWKLT